MRTSGWEQNFVRSKVSVLYMIESSAKAHQRFDKGMQCKVSGVSEGIGGYQRGGSLDSTRDYSPFMSRRLLIYMSPKPRHPNRQIA